jgi:hypothetical protein
LSWKRREGERAEERGRGRDGKWRCKEKRKQHSGKEAKEHRNGG